MLNRKARIFFDFAAAKKHQQTCKFVHFGGFFNDTMELHHTNFEEQMVTSGRS